MNSINNLLLIFLTCILMQSCDSPTQSQQTNSEHWSSDIVLVDTFRNKLHLAEVEYFTSKIYAPMYWGEIQDSIILVYNSKYVGDRGEFGFPNRDSFQIKSFSNLELYVDTSRDVGSAQYYTHPPPPPPGSSQKAIEDYEKAEFKPYRGNVLSHPIFIRNTG
ncbi:MAG: hypothetical protein MK212_21360, partial [Saprospiraceae bacterium]|nr:hypothetical protein [Saprospiraceae bacterium]